MANDDTNHETKVIGELSDNELDAVSGGLHVPPPPPPPPSPGTHLLNYINVTFVENSVAHEDQGAEHQFQTTSQG
jgi:bacteriocin-like protein